MHGLSRMTIDPRIPTVPGRSTSGFTNQVVGMVGVVVVMVGVVVMGLLGWYRL